MKIKADDLKQKGLEEAAAEKLAAEINAIIAKADIKKPENIWHELRAKVLTPEQPIKSLRFIYDEIYSAWDKQKQGPRPVWKADKELLAKTNISAILKEKNFKNYDELFEWSIKNGREFWSLMVKRLGLVFKNDYVPDEKNIVDTKNPENPKWFPGEKLNVADNCFLAPADALAIIYKKEGGRMRHITYGELAALVNKIANGLHNSGFKKGDRIAIDMPMNVEAVAVYLAILKIGAAVVSLADSFKAQDIEVRIDAASPVKAVFTQDFTGGSRKYPLYENVIKAKNLPPAIVISDEEERVKLQREDDIHFADFLKNTSADFVSVETVPEDFINIIFSSSTSSPKEKDGQKPKPPKAIPWKANSAFKSAIDAHLHHNMQAGKVLCWPTNLGWMMGAFDIFAAFMNKGTLALFDGNVVSARFTKFVEEAGVNVLGVVPSIVESWEKTNAVRKADWSNIELFSSTGSPSNPGNYFYLSSRVPGFAPVIEYMGGTEIGGAYLTCSLHHIFSPSTFSTTTLGTEIYTPEETSEDAMQGEVFIVMRNGKGECPAMGLSTELLNFDHHEKYFARGVKSPEGHLLREHGDLIIRHAGGLISSGGRADDGININGIKTSSLDIENYIKDAHIEGVKEVAAIGIRPPEGGEDWLVIFATGDKQHISAERLKSPVKDAIKARNPQLARVHDVVLVEELPLTASGKLRRRYLQDMYADSIINHRII